MTINVNGLPWGTAHIILNTLRNERCTPDHVLLLADAIEQFLPEFGPTAHYRAAIIRVVDELRDIAKEYDKIGYTK